MYADHYIGFDVHKETIQYCIKPAGRAMSYCRLVAPLQESAGIHYRQPLSKKCNAQLQAMLIEAAHLAPRYHPELRRLYDEAKQGRHAGVAALIVARKLVSYLPAVDKSREPFQLGTQQTETAPDPQTERPLLPACAAHGRSTNRTAVLVVRGPLRRGKGGRALDSSGPPCREGDCEGRLRRESGSKPSSHIEVLNSPGLLIRDLSGLKYRTAFGESPASPRLPGTASAGVNLVSGQRGCFEAGGFTLTRTSWPAQFRSSK